LLTNGTVTFPMKSRSRYGTADRIVIPLCDRRVVANPFGEDGDLKVHKVT
jgi:hypothetical protein